MARARGSNAICAGAFEATYGAPPTSGFRKLPFVTSQLGEERNWIASDLLGYGREPLDPVQDVANNTGDLVVPVDVNNFGNWLRLYMGSPSTTAGTGGPNTHVFTSGASSLPSMSIEIGLPDVPSFGMNYGVRGSTMKIDLSRSGLLNATLGLIAKGEALAGATAAGTPAAATVTRFTQATGGVKKDGQALGGVVSANFTFTNNLEIVDTIQPDGRIEDADAGMVGMTGSIVVRFADTTLLSQAASGAPCDLSFGWASGANSLIFDVPRVFLPSPKRPVTGPNGIQATFDFQASGSAGHAVTATLVNGVSGYAG